MSIRQLIKLKLGSYKSILLNLLQLVKNLLFHLRYQRICHQILLTIQLFLMGNQIFEKHQNFTYAINQSQFQSDGEIFTKGVPQTIEFIRKNNLQTWKHKGKNKYFCGKFVENTAQGLGVIFIPDQLLYQGYLHEGFPHGTGRIEFMNRMQIYEGNFHNGMAHGSGKYEKLTENNKFNFIGQWQHSHPIKGVVQTVSNQHVKSIQVVNFKSGEAIINFHNGNVYSGKINSYFEPHGQGIMKYNHADSKVQIYKGQFERGKFHGEGYCKWRDGSQYTGHYVQGSKEGKGVYKYSSGEIFEGQWLKGNMHGKGKLTKDGKETLSSIFIAGIPLLALLGDQKQKLFSHQKLPVIHSSQREQVSAAMILN